MPAPRKTPAPVRPEGDARVVLFTGGEQRRKVKEAEQRLVQAADPEFADFDGETLDGGNATADGILSAVATIALGRGKKVVLVRDVQQLDAEEQKRLASGLGSIPERSLLLLVTGSPIIEDGKTKRSSVVGSELSGAVKKLGEIVDLAAPRPEDLRGVLVQQARALGKTLDPDALALLVQLPPEESSRAGVELEKAALHAGVSAKITRADVEATLSRSPDDVIFKLCDAVGGRKTAEALDHVATLFKGGARPDAVAPRTLVMLARQVRLLLQFRWLGENKMAGRNAGPLTPQAQALLPSEGAAATLSNPRTSWMADKMVGQARLFTSAELTDRLEKILEADLALKGALPGGDDPRALLQRLIVALG